MQHYVGHAESVIFFRSQVGYNKLKVRSLQNLAKVFSNFLSVFMLQPSQGLESTEEIPCER